MVGLSTLVIAFCQPIIAYFRPGKVSCFIADIFHLSSSLDQLPKLPGLKARHCQDHPMRPVFYAVHASLGYIAIVLALTAVYLKNYLPPADQVRTIPEDQVVSVAEDQVMAVPEV